MKHGPPAGASAALRKEEDQEMEFGDSASQTHNTRSNP
jgi:hypothetical protein